jgi:alkanesulfonate monooxygenase SsuD/methylene tetrahydromethanopterin reductase-like flavin-dependent oxidoreductase (luciferase family)
MQYGVIITGGDPLAQADLALAAEAAGWDAVFTYDAIAIGEGEMHDPWVLLAAMAMRTTRIRIGAMVFAPTRRRPWKLAREAATLDIVSGGRLVLPVGLGALDDQGFGNVGEITETRVRAQLLDETLAILEGLWSGEPFSFEGDHYRFSAMTFRPTPVQRPRIPIWVVGAWPHARSMRRAARWDGVVVQATAPDGSPAGHQVLPEIVGWLAGARAREGRSGPFEIVVDGTTPAHDRAAAAETARLHAEAGATWWTGRRMRRDCGAGSRQDRLGAERAGSPDQLLAVPTGASPVVDGASWGSLGASASSAYGAPWPATSSTASNCVW